jgi:hypothetical protein
MIETRREIVVADKASFIEKLVPQEDRPFLGTFPRGYGILCRYCGHYEVMHTTLLSTASEEEQKTRRLDYPLSLNQCLRLTKYFPENTRIWLAAHGWFTSPQRKVG